VKKLQLLEKTKVSQLLPQQEVLDRFFRLHKCCEQSMSVASETDFRVCCLETDKIESDITFVQSCWWCNFLNVLSSMSYPVHSKIIVNFDR
jgi:hypothetical protein